MYVPEPAPGLSVSFWGHGPEVERAIAQAFTEHRATWQREQRRREEAQAVGDRVRDAILEGSTTRAAVAAFLAAVPPPPTLYESLAAMVRRVSDLFARTQRSSHA